jgi:hypothetical protein
VGLLRIPRHDYDAADTCSCTAVRFVGLLGTQEHNGNAVDICRYAAGIPQHSLRNAAQHCRSCSAAGLAVHVSSPGHPVSKQRFRTHMQHRCSLCSCSSLLCSRSWRQHVCCGVEGQLLVVVRHKLNHV